MTATLRETPLSFRECRSYRHPWSASTVDYDKRADEYTETLVCPRCTAERVSILDGEGYTLTSKIKYPTGYLLQGAGRVAPEHRAALRLESVRRRLRR